MPKGIRWAVLLLALFTVPAGAAPDVGVAAPGALGVDLDGRSLEVEDFAGRVLVVSFWASWCGPCINEMQILDNLQRQVPSDQLAVVAVNIEDRRRFRDVAKRLQRKAKSVVTLVNVSDAAALDRWDAHQIPRLFLIDDAGVLAFQHKGYSEQALPGFVDEINKLLARRAARPAPVEAPESPPATGT